MSLLIFENWIKFCFFFGMYISEEVLNIRIEYWIDFWLMNFLWSIICIWSWLFCKVKNWNYDVFVYVSKCIFCMIMKLKVFWCLMVVV